METSCLPKAASHLPSRQLARAIPMHDTLLKSAETTQSPTLRRRIVIVDDHELVRLGVGQLIQQHPDWELSGEAVDAESALELIQRIEPDLALIDLRLGAGDGLSLIRQVHATAPAVKMLVSSMQDEELFAERCIRAGALGFINKQQSVQVLVSAIERVLEGKIFLSAEMMERTLLRNAGRRDGGLGKPLEILSDREMEVFERFGDGKNVKQIAHELHISVKTVEYHRQHIKAKLKLPSSYAVTRLATMYTLGSDADLGKEAANLSDPPSSKPSL